MSKFDFITSLEVLNSIKGDSEYHTVVLTQADPFLHLFDAGFCHEDIEHTFCKIQNLIIKHGDILSIVLGNLTYRLLHSLSFLKWCLKTALRTAYNTEFQWLQSSWTSARFKVRR